MATRISIDPVTRIEGHLRIDCEIDNGRVSKAWASGQMWRGIERIVKGRDPREVWLFTQRICGVCTTVHAIASVRAVEDALAMEVPLNAQYIRNLMIAAHAVHDHIVHFYQLSALDWVDITSALKADPKQTAALAQNLSNWRLDSPQEFRSVQEKLKGFVGSGQLGIFANGYWGHPAMILPPEVNLLAVTHYLQALEVQRKASMIVSILGGKSPHIQNLAVGGVANPINPDSPSTLTVERLYYLKTLIDEVGDFVNNAHFTDVCVLGGYYSDWGAIGGGVSNYLCVPDFPLDTKGTVFAHPGGFLPRGEARHFRPIDSFQDEYFRNGVQESVKHSWYQGYAAHHPWEQEPEPEYTDFEDDGKYSWVKSPTFFDQTAQVGPLANVLCMHAAGHEPTIRYTAKALDLMGDVAGKPIPMSALRSTLGRHAARAIRTAVIYDTLRAQWQALIDNIAKGDTETFNPPLFPSGEVRGVGFHEAPRGVLSHWVVVENEKVKNYQAVVPSTWNSGPRNGRDVPGPYEAALIGTPVADPEKPLEVLRTVHSFDPCLACAIHLVDGENREIVQVRAF